MGYVKVCQFKMYTKIEFGKKKNTNPILSFFKDVNIFCSSYFIKILDTSSQLFTMTRKLYTVINKFERRDYVL